MSCSARDGALLATASASATVRVFDNRTGRELNRLANPGPSAVPAAENAVRSMAFSPDGLLSATGTDDETPRVFETRPGRELSRVTLPEKSEPELIAVSRDRMMMGVRLEKGRSLIYGVRSGREVLQTEFHNYLSSIRFDTRSTLVTLVSHFDRSWRTFDIRSGREPHYRLDYFEVPSNRAGS